MDSTELSKAVEAADSLYAVLAIGIIGLYLLLWKYGGEILKLTRSNSVADAVEELSQTLNNHIEEFRTTRLEIQKLRADLALQSTLFATYRSEIDRLLRSFDGRLSALEGDTHV